MLGVATVSGTYVLTDSIDKAFNSIFTDVRQGSNVVISGKAAFDLTSGAGSTAPAFDESLLEKVRALPGVEVADGSVSNDAVQLIGKDGKAIVYGGAPNLGFSIARGGLPVQPAHARPGVLAGRRRGRDRQVDGRQRGLRRRRLCRRTGRRPGAPPPHLRNREVRLGGDDRRRHARRFRPPHRARPLRQARQARRDRGQVKAWRVRRGGRSPDRADPAPRHPGPDGRAAGSGGCEGHEPVHLVPSELPARVRRRRALRRQLRHRQFVVDHDRTAHPRARHVANCRRLAAPGAPLDRRRGARRRRLRLGDRPVPRPVAREGSLLALRRRGIHAAEQRPDLRDAHDRRVAPRRDRRDASGQPPPRVPRDARPAHRSRTRRRHPARVTLCALPRPGLDPPGRARLRRSALRIVRAQPQHHTGPRADRSSARCLSSSGSRSCQSGSCNRLPRRSDGPPRRSAAPPASSHETTRSATLSGRPRRPRRS